MVCGGDLSSSFKVEAIRFYAFMLNLLCFKFLGKIIDDDDDAKRVRKETSTVEDEEVEVEEGNSGMKEGFTVSRNSLKKLEIEKIDSA